MFGKENNYPFLCALGKILSSKDGVISCPINLSELTPDQAQVLFKILGRKVRGVDNSSIFKSDIETELRSGPITYHASYPPCCQRRKHP